MLEFGHFFLTCRFFPFFALCEFIDYCKQYLTMYLTGLDRMGARLTRLTWGIYLHTLLPGTFFKVGRRAGQLDSGIKTSFLLWSHNSSQTRRHAELVCSRVDLDES